MRLPRAGRRAISEVVGTVLVAAITIIAGAGIFGYVNEEAGSSAQAYGQQVGNSVQYLEEKYTVVDLVWSSSTSMTIWIYNTGKIQLTLLQVRWYDSAGTINLLYNYSTISGSVVNRVHDLRSSGAGRCGTSATSYESPLITGPGSFADPISNTATIQLTIPPFSSGCPTYGQNINLQSPPDTYYVAVVGTYGNSFTYSQAKTT